MTARKTSATKFHFEKSMDELAKLVEKMEQGDLSLEQSLKNFEQGVLLIRHCQKALKEAEQKVKILTKEQGKESLKHFESDE